MLYRVHFAFAGFELTNLVVISTDCIGSYKSNYHTIRTTTAPNCIGGVMVSMAATSVVGDIMVVII